MSPYKRRSLISVCVVSCYLTIFAGVGLTKEDEVTSLKKQLKEMQQQMQRLLQRIEQIEKKSEESTLKDSSQAPPQDQVNQKRAGNPQGAQTNLPSSGIVGSIARAFNPAISVNGLFLGGWASSVDASNKLTGLNFENGFNFQEAEFRFTSDVDPYFKADMILAIDRKGDIVTGPWSVRPYLAMRGGMNRQPGTEVEALRGKAPRRYAKMGAAGDALPWSGGRCLSQAMGVPRPLVRIVYYRLCRR